MALRMGGDLNVSYSYCVDSDNELKFPEKATSTLWIDLSGFADYIPDRKLHHIGAVFDSFVSHLLSILYLT